MGLVEHGLGGGGAALLCPQSRHVGLGVLPEVDHQGFGILHAHGGGNGRANELLHGVDHGAQSGGSGQTALGGGGGHQGCGHSGTVNDGHTDQNRVLADDGHDQAHGKAGRDHAQSGHQHDSPFTDHLLDVDGGTHIEQHHTGGCLGQLGQTGLVDDVAGKNSGQEGNQEQKHDHHHSGKLSLGEVTDHVA